MKILIVILAITLLFPTAAFCEPDRATQRELEEIKDEMWRQRAIENERRRIENERREEQERQQAIENKKRRIENKRNLRELKRIRAAQRRQQRAEEEKRRAEEEKQRLAEEEAKFERLQDMASQNPNSKYSKLYEIELLKRSGAISDHQADVRSEYVLHGPSGGIGPKKGGGITISEKITDPVMQAKGLKKGDTFVDE